MSAPSAPPGSSLGSSPEPDRAELVRAILDDVQLLFQKHVQLAREEMLQALEARITAMAAGATAAVLGLFALGFLASAAAYGLDTVMAAWLARLVVGAGFLLITAIAGLIGWSRLKSPRLEPEETKRTLKEDLRWARTRLGR